MVVLGQSSKPAEVQREAPPLVTGIQQYWDLTPEQKSKPVLLRLECDVTYADPAWKMFYIQDASGQGAYVPYGDNLFPFKAGQHIVATGMIAPRTPTFRSSMPPSLSKAHPNLSRIPLQERSCSLSRSARSLSAARVWWITPAGPIPPTFSSFSRSKGNPFLPGCCSTRATSVPDLGNTNVRIEGVYNPKIGPDNKLSSLEILVPGLNHLTIINRLEDDPRFQTPAVPIESLSRLPPDRLVHIGGRVKAQEPGRYVRVRDESGQIDVLTGQTTLCPINARIEAVGYPAIIGAEWRLRSGLFRLASDRAAAREANRPAPPCALRSK